MRALRYVLSAFAVCILILVSFLGGFLTRNWMLARLQQKPAGVEEQFSVFWEAWNVAERNFVDAKALDDKTMTYGAIRGMLDSLGDLGHTRFMTPEDLAAERTSISGKYSGIGAEIGVRDGMPMIRAPFDDSPAYNAGLQPGDIIVRVDGEETAGMSLDQVVSRIKGPQGTSVTLTIMRTDSASLLEFTVVRDTIRVAAVSWAMIPETHIAHIRITQFSENAMPDLRTALQGARSANAGALIIDLRNNPGGLLDQVVQVASQFLDSGNIVLEEDRAGNRKPYAVRSGGTATEIPIVVLVNEGSASASEIFAGAIQDQERGTIVGQPTFGTGTILSTFTLSDGSAMLLGTGQWLTPNGRSLRHEGITPDEDVALAADGQMLTPKQTGTLSPDEIEKAGDAQVSRAIEILTAKLTVTLPESAPMTSLPDRVCSGAAN